MVKGRRFLCLLYILPLVLAVLYIYHPWIFNTDIIARGDWKARSSAWMEDYLDGPSIWDKSTFGGTSFLHAGKLARYPVLYIQALLHEHLGTGYAGTERVLWFFPFFIISAVSMFLLGNYLFDDWKAALFAALYFVSNNFIIFRVHGGQLTLAMSYALTPLALYFFIRALKEKKAKYLLLNIVTLGALSYYELRIVFLTFLIQAAYFCFILLKEKSKWKKILLRGLVYFLITGLCLLIANSFWLLPFMENRGGGVAPEDVISTSLTDIKNVYSRTSFFDAAVSSIGANSDWNGFIYWDGQIVTALLFPIGVIIYGLSLLSKNKIIYLWLAVGLVTAFFAKGLNPPLSSINALFYKYAPFASMYRLPDKFLLVGSTAICLCFGVGCSSLLNLVKRSRPLRWLSGVFLFALPLLVIYPALYDLDKSFATTVGGTSFSPFVSSKYLQYEDCLSNQEEDYKSAIIPDLSYFFVSDNYPRYFPSTQVQKRSQLGKVYLEAFSTVGGLKSLGSDAYFSNNLLNIFAASNIRYIFLAPKDDTLWDWFNPGAKSLIYENVSSVESLDTLCGLSGAFLIPDALSNFVVTSGSPVSVGSSYIVEGDTKFTRVGKARYSVKIHDPPSGEFYLNFLDGYSKNWIVEEENIKASLSNLGTNYFKLENSSNSETLVYSVTHSLQKFVDIGWRVTVVFWFCFSLCLLYLLFG